MSDSGPKRPKPGQGRIMVPWWALSALCGLAGFVTAKWAGMVVGAGLGYVAWKLR